MLARVDVVDRRAAALFEQAERLVDVFDLEDQRADAIGVLRQEPRGATALADRLAAHDLDVAGLEARRLLTALLLELGRAPPGLGEVELVDVELPRPLEVVHVIVDAFEALDSEGFELGHDYFTASGCWSGAAFLNAGSARQRASIASEALVARDIGAEPPRRRHLRHEQAIGDRHRIADAELPGRVARTAASNAARPVSMKPFDHTRDVGAERLDVRSSP